LLQSLALLAPWKKLDQKPASLPMVGSWPRLRRANRRPSGSSGPLGRRTAAV